MNVANNNLVYGVYVGFDKFPCSELLIMIPDANVFFVYSRKVSILVRKSDLDRIIEDSTVR